MEQTIKEIENDRDYWLELERFLPWKLFGFSYKDKASFDTNPGTLILSASQYEQILNAIKGKE